MLMQLNFFVINSLQQLFLENVIFPIVSIVADSCDWVLMVAVLPASYLESRALEINLVSRLSLDNGSVRWGVLKVHSFIIN